MVTFDDSQLFEMAASLLLARRVMQFVSLMVKSLHVLSAAADKSTARTKTVLSLIVVASCLESQLCLAPLLICTICAINNSCGFYCTHNNLVYV